MSLRLLQLALACLALLGLATYARAGMNADTPYTERGQTDFDTALKLLNPYGTWSKIGGKWAYTPLDHEAPYTDGRWLYTEFGWYWKGRLPHSWVTEHYGYWKCGADKIWSWYPGPYWLPEIMEIRSTSTYIGWRSGEVDEDGNFVEAPIDRYGKPEEWTFVTLAQFANPITPKMVAPLDVATQQLEDSTDSRHTYLTYREIDRPGPHPADFVSLCKDGLMLAPLSAQDRMAAAQPPPPSPVPFANTPAVHMTGTNAPALIGADADPTGDTRKVKYWITMSLPTFWSKPPPDARPDQMYVYRPDIFQDEDGIARRISLWFNPLERTSLKDILGSNSPTAKPSATPSGPGTPAIPASPAVSEAGEAFRSPLDDHSASPESRPASTSSKVPAPAAPSTAVPDGLAPTK